MFESHLKPPISFPTLTGSIVTFNSQYAGLPLKSCVVDIPVTQEGTGDPSPDNIRDFISFSGVNVSRTGKNLLDTTNAVNGGINADGSVNANPSDPRKVTKMLPVKPNTAYYFRNVVSAVYGRSGYWYDASGNGIGLISFGGVSASSGTATSLANAAYCRVCYFATNESICMMSLGTTQPTDYELYTGNTYQITFGQTVYGGEYDARTGVLTVTHGYIASYNGEVINEPWISSMDKYVEGGTPTSGAQVVYPLSTPQTIQLSPCPIDTLEGVNNIWADTGNTTLQYPKFG
jgi:hypothetical protein